MVPFFVPGVPGGPELLLVLLIGSLYLVVPILVMVAVYNFLDGKRAYEERITALERRIDELEGKQS